MFILALLLGLDAAGYGLSEGMGRQLSVRERREEARENLLWAGRAIRAYEARTGQLPSGSRDIGLLPEHGWAYERTAPHHFTLSLSRRGSLSTYDSTRDQISFIEVRRGAEGRPAPEAGATRGREAGGAP